MKNKLIPKHQKGKKILNWFVNQFIKFGNAQIAGDSGVGTAMAIASGYQHNPKKGMWEQSEENVKEAEGLRNNLSFLSSFSDTYPATAAFKGLGYLFKWRPFLPKGSKTTVYRQGNLDMIDDAVESGVIRAQPETKYLTKINTKKSKYYTEPYFEIAMFNKEKPFWQNPKLFEKTFDNAKGTFVGDMNKSSVKWINKPNKYFKDIYITKEKQIPVSEFDIYTRLPYEFGWFKNIHKSANNIPYGIIPQIILKPNEK